MCKAQRGREQATQWQASHPERARQHREKWKVPLVECRCAVCGEPYMVKAGRTRMRRYCGDLCRAERRALLKQIRR
jgi:hypothetical protein